MGKLSKRGREKKLWITAGWRPTRHVTPPRPQNDFTPRYLRRRSLVGQMKNWRPVWAATRGWGPLVAAFAERVEQARKAAG